MGTEVVAAMAIVSAVVGAGSALHSANEQRKAAQMAEAIAEDNARLSQLETEQTVRNLEKQQDQQLALARARAAASGVEGASVDSYMEALKAEGIEQMDWLKEVGASRYKVALESGQFAGAQARSNMWGSIGKAAQYGSSAYSSGYEAEFWGTHS